MDYRSLGRTGMQVSTLSLGSMLFGGETDAAEATTLVEHVIEWDDVWRGTSCFPAEGV